MDIKKDSNLELFSRVLDLETRSDFFDGNINANRAYRRLERIVGAIILMTNHIDNNPLKREIRLSSVGALKKMLELRSEMRNTTSSKMTELFSSLHSLVSFSKLLVLEGHVSFQNAELIVEAINDFTAYLTATGKSPLSDVYQFSKDDFLLGTETYKGHKKDIKDSIVKDIYKLSPLPQLSQSKRTASIIDILKATKEANIKDVAMHLPEYGEKTIQRELSTLVSRGVVKRTGLKRWSRYSLVETTAVDSMKKD